MKDFFSGVAATIVAGIAVAAFIYFFLPGQPRAPKVEILGQVLHWDSIHTNQFVRDITRIVTGATGEELEELLADLPRELHWLSGLDVGHYTVRSKETQLSQNILFEAPDAWLTYIVDEDREGVSYSGSVAHEFRLRPNESVDIVVVRESSFGGTPSATRDFESHFWAADRKLDVSAIQNHDIIRRLLEKGFGYYVLVVSLFKFACVAVVAIALFLVLVVACKLYPKLLVNVLTSEGIGQALAVFEVLPKKSSKRKGALEIKEKTLKHL